MLAQLERLAGLTRERIPTRTAEPAAKLRQGVVVYEAPVIGGQVDEDAAFGVAKMFHNEMVRLDIDPAETRLKLAPFAHRRCRVVMDFALFANEPGRILQRTRRQKTITFGPSPYDDLFGVAGLYASEASRVLRALYEQEKTPDRELESSELDDEDDVERPIVPGTGKVTYLVRRITVYPVEP